ncbi:hypothetical protein [Desulfovibrio oxyclinae]|jgi:NAD(P)-dependent dehydrogenase (short-subunit alcohol dehydrogenase family)|uniref:hypothetical protein n=1 Tax=Desulfovibrio oxyclinae TaxID=63560 RepID=UPI00036A4916|nr:hypothetical protein [Desulfovibrio oxyclinae]
MAAFDRLKNWWGDIKARRALAREVAPKNIRAMAVEVGELARLASQVSHASPELHELIENVRTEMARLENLAGKPEFRKLSTGKRILLRQGLLQSKEQLLESIDKAPTPTERLQ